MRIRNEHKEEKQKLQDFSFEGDLQPATSDWQDWKLTDPVLGKIKFTTCNDIHTAHSLLNDYIFCIDHNYHNSGKSYILGQLTLACVYDEALKKARHDSLPASLVTDFQNNILLVKDFVTGQYNEGKVARISNYIHQKFA